MKNAGTNKSYYKMNLFIKSDDGSNIDSKQFVKELRKNRDTRYIFYRVNKVINCSIDLYCYNFDFFVREKGGLLLKKIPVMVEISENGYTDIISGYEYCSSSMIPYSHAPVFLVPKEISSSYVADIIRNMSEGEIADYNKKSLALSRFFIDYTDKLKKQDKMKAEERSWLDYKNQTDNEFIQNFQRQRTDMGN